MRPLIAATLVAVGVLLWIPGSVAAWQELEGRQSPRRLVCVDSQS